MFVDQMSALDLRVEEGAPYVSGHCTFSSVARACKHLDVDRCETGSRTKQEGLGARRVRLLLASMYFDKRNYSTLQNWTTVPLAKLIEHRIGLAQDPL